MPRVLLIGLDGADPDLVTRWMDAGRLPQLAALRREGVFLPCQSTVPPVTFPAWTTCVTGVNPGRHGIFDFTEVIPGAYRIRFVNSSYRKVPALWNVLSDAGKRVGVLGVPGTFPPEPVNGFMVSGFDSPVATGVDASCVYPRSLYPEVRDWRFADFQESHLGPGWHARALRSLLNKIADKERIAQGLLRREPWDFFMAVFGESDTVSHHFWLFHDPASPRHRPGPQDAIQRVYERLDQTVGVLREAAGRDAVTIVVSDHGFGGAGTGVVHLNNWLAQSGYLRFRRQRGSLIKGLALATTPVAWRGALFRRFRAIAEGAESTARFGGIDWAHTRAWSEELNYFPSIRVNLAGREPQGQVPQVGYDAFVAGLCAQLEAWPAVRRAWPRAALFEGEHASRAPDIVLELALEDGYSHSCLRSRGGPPFRRLRPEEYFGGKERGMTGNHRPMGICLLSRPCAAQACTLQDIAPTVLALLDTPAPPMDGVALIGGLNRKDTPAPPRAEYHLSPEESAVVEARLRGLGYYE